jgi:hypothetical protein
MQEAKMHEFPIVDDLRRLAGDGSGTEEQENMLAAADVIEAFTSTNAELREQVARLENKLEVAEDRIRNLKLEAEAAEHAAVKVDRDLIEQAVQAAIDAGLAVNGEHGVAAARHAARFILYAPSTAESEPEQEAVVGGSATAYSREQLAKLAYVTFYSPILCGPQNIKMVVDEIDCCPGCDHVSNGGTCSVSERGDYCPNDLAETLRQISAALYGPSDPSHYVESVFGPDKVTALARPPLAPAVTEADPSSIAIDFLEEIADGAWGDNPALRGAARDRLEALKAAMESGA